MIQPCFLAPSDNTISKRSVGAALEMHEDVTGLPIPQDGDGLRVGVVADRFLEPIQPSITSPSAARLEVRKAGVILRELTC